MKKDAERHLFDDASIAQFGDQIFKRYFLILNLSIVRENRNRLLFFHLIVPPALVFNCILLRSGGKVNGSGALFTES